MRGPDAPGGALFARTVALKGTPEEDPAALVGRDGLGFQGPELTLVAWGSAAEVPLAAGPGDPTGRDALETLLGAIATRDEVGRPGCGPLALGALPFAPGAPGHLRVPAVILGIAGDACWLTVVGPERPDTGRDRLAALLSARRAHVLESSAGVAQRGGPPLSVTPRPDPEGFVAAVGAAVEDIQAGLLDKVVLARCVEVTGLPDLEPSALLGRIRRREPTATAFVVPVEGGHFLGATPELIVARRGPVVECHPLAGTTDLEGAGAPGDRLLSSAKDLEEHRLVVQAVKEALRPRCATLEVPEHPEVVRLGTDARLSTRIVGRLRADEPLPSSLALVGELHPTPAVGGVPTAEALRIIGGAEPLPRGYWAGPVGWTDASGDGEWVLGIRSLTLSGDRARIWAGAGVVAGSDPRAELEETTLKLEPVVEAILSEAGAEASAVKEARPGGPARVPSA